MTVGEWDQRQLCPDGGCVGVIGQDGTCKVCGRVAQNWGDERKRGLIDPPDEDTDDTRAAADAEADAHAEAEAEDDLDDEDEDDDLDGEHDDDDLDAEHDDEHDSDGEAAVEGDAVAAEPAAIAAPVEWGERALCPDGSCIGVIGSDGTCKVCGRAASGAPPARTADEPAPAGPDSSGREP